MLKNKWFNKKSQKFTLSSKLLAFSSLLLAICSFIWLLYPDKAISGPYLNSSHGNSTYGVNRTSLTSFGYSKGNCVHCHEQHASIGGSEPNPTGGPDKYCLLANNFNTSKTMNPYIQNDSVCFYCHISIGTLQSPSFSNYSYSITFGGNPDATPNNIFDAFNGLSYHNLYDIWRLITGLSGTKTFTNFPSDSNPCSGCHNIHIARRSCGKPSGSFDTTKSAISRPSDHGNLWGDGEKMSDYTGGYQAPYWYASTNYEPNNSPSSDPSILPDYVTFCTDCHTSTANSVWSTTLSRWLRPVDWNVEKHGIGVSDGDDGAARILSPYSTTNKVLACTDCHEPHGAPNVVLIRQEVNGGALSGQITTLTTLLNKELGYLCRRCHQENTPGSNNWWNTHHADVTLAQGCGGTAMMCHGILADDWACRTCSRCHYHGAVVTDGTLSKRTF
ncbi:MAG: hypothetical protein WA126_16235 [Thermodesulfovibrionales bacterium]